MTYERHCNDKVFIVMTYERHCNDKVSIVMTVKRFILVKHAGIDCSLADASVSLIS